MNFHHPIDRIDEKIHEEPNSGCWLWGGALQSTGYGNVWFEGKMNLAHRVMHEHHVGKIPDGLELDHLCRNRACCNPAHVEPVTHRENIVRGDAPKHYKEKTHCPKGHQYDDENTYIVPRTGFRQCRACTRDRKRKAAEKIGKGDTDGKEAS